MAETDDNNGENTNWWDSATDVLLSLAGTAGSAYTAEQQRKAAEAAAEKERLASATATAAADEKKNNMVKIGLIVGGGLAVVAIAILALK